MKKICRKIHLKRRGLGIRDWGKEEEKTSRRARGGAERRKKSKKKENLEVFCGKLPQNWCLTPGKSPLRALRLCVRSSLTKQSFCGIL
jgi:hypothetical protein